MRGSAAAARKETPAQTMSANAPQQSSCPVARSCPTLRNGPHAAHRASLSATVSQTLLVFLGPVRPAISSSIAPFSWPRGLFLCQFFASGGQSTGASASASVLPMNIQDWFPLGLKGLLRVFPSTTVWKHQFFSSQASLQSNPQMYVTIGKTKALTLRTFVSKVMSLLLNMLSRVVTAFLPRSKRLLISWQQSPSTVIVEPKNIKSVTVCTFSPSICH